MEIIATANNLTTKWYTNHPISINKKENFSARKVSLVFQWKQVQEGSQFPT